MLNRREFLSASCGTLSLVKAPAWLPTRAAGERRLVVLTLNGGNDGLNTLVPVEDDLYYKARPALALRGKDLHKIDALNSLHPALGRTARHYHEGRVAFLQGVGYPQPSLSHFRSMDIWDSASLASLRPAHGWIGRTFDAQYGATSSPVTLLAVGTGVAPYALRAATGVPCTLAKLDEYRIKARPARGERPEARSRNAAIVALNPADQTGVFEHVSASVKAARVSIRELAALSKIRSRVRYPGFKLGRDLHVVGRAIEHGLATRIFHVTHDGFDTHAAQAKPHHECLRDFDGAMSALLDDLAQQGNLDSTLILVTSEFGRRVAQSGIGNTAGTDHGAAGVAMLLGGAVQGGVHGQQPDLAQLDQTGNLVHSVDFRQIYATVIEDWLGGDAQRVLGASFDKLEVLA